MKEREKEGIVEKFWNNWESSNASRYDVANKDFLERAIRFGIDQTEQKLSKK